jgi:zinc transport system ATP-binding protein
MNSVITLKDISYSYNAHLVLEDVSISIHEKDFVGMIGPNGGGKTTLLRLMLGFLTPTRGTVRVMGQHPRKVRRLIGYVPQHMDVDRDFPIAAKEVVAMGVMGSRSFLPWFGASQWTRVMEAMEAVGIERIAEQRFSELSVGQRQRCLIARALVSRPQILILDEPTASVDNTAEKDIYELLHSINKDVTILLASHDVSFISKYVNRVVCVNRLAACHMAKDVTVELVQSLYQSDVAMMQHKCEL